MMRRETRKRTRRSARNKLGRFRNHCIFDRIKTLGILGHATAPLFPYAESIPQKGATKNPGKLGANKMDSFGFVATALKKGQTNEADRPGQISMGGEKENKTNKKRDTTRNRLYT